MPWQNHHRQENYPPVGNGSGTLQLCGVVFIGFMIGLSGISFYTPPRPANIPDLSLFLIGIQLRNNGG